MQSFRLWDIPSAREKCVRPVRQLMAQLAERGGDGRAQVRELERAALQSRR
jgi:hypothetical protein